MERLRRPETFGSSGDLVAALGREPAVGLLAGMTADGDVWVTWVAWSPLFATMRSEARMEDFLRRLRQLQGKAA